MYRRTADTGCPDGPCPVISHDADRGMTALQGYDPTADLDPSMGPKPPGESRIEITDSVLEDLLAQHLTDEALTRIIARRAALRVAV